MGSLVKSDIVVFPYSVEHRRPLGCEPLNTHSDYITRALECNSNIQIGSPRCVFYVVHYSTKSTQKEDEGVDFEWVGQQAIRRIQKEGDWLVLQELERAPDQNEDVCFHEGLFRFLIGMSVHLSQDVVSATMAYLLICQRDSRLTFSHNF